MLKLWPIVGLLSLSCSSPVSEYPLEDRVMNAALIGWDKAGFLEPNEEWCSLTEFRVLTPKSEESYLKLCKQKSNGCFRELLSKGRIITKTIPTAVIRPSVPLESVEGLAVHELLHWLQYCTGNGISWQDPYDKDHTMPEVWGRENSATSYAQEVLDSLPTLEADCQL